DHPIGRLQGEYFCLGVIELKQSIGKPYLVQDLHDRWMNGIATKIAVEVHVFFKQHYGDALTSEKQSKYCSCRSTTYNTTSCFFSLLWLFVLHNNIILHSDISYI